MFKQESAAAVPLSDALAAPTTVMDVTVDQVDVEVALVSLNQWQLAFKRFLRHRMALIGLFTFTAIVIVAIVGPIVAPYNPIDIPGALHDGGASRFAANGSSRSGRLGRGSRTHRPAATS